MTDKEKIGALLETLTHIRRILGIRRDFVPLGPAIPIEQAIQKVMKEIGVVPASKPRGD